jgi:ubiquitin C-terminal hydrolase
VGHTIDGGHYTAFVKRKDLWFKCNDESVVQVAASSVVSADASVLVYERCDSTDKSDAIDA